MVVVTEYAALADADPGITVVVRRAIKPCAALEDAILAEADTLCAINTKWAIQKPVAPKVFEL